MCLIFLRFCFYILVAVNFRRLCQQLRERRGGDCEEEEEEIDEQVSTPTDLRKSLLMVVGTVMFCSSIIFGMNQINRQS